MVGVLVEKQTKYLPNASQKRHWLDQLAREGEAHKGKKRSDTGRNDTKYKK
jgi:hypothetical protein